jgi:hypothetical protein
MKAYAITIETENPELAHDLNRWVDGIEKENNNG